MKMVLLVGVYLDKVYLSYLSDNVLENWNYRVTQIVCIKLQRAKYYHGAAKLWFDLHLPVHTKF